jgi:hypothetical protein
MIRLGVVSLCLLASLLLPMSSYGKEDVIASIGDVSVNEQDIMLALSPAAEDKRASIVSNPKLMSQIIERVLFNRVLASRVVTDFENAGTTDEDALARDARLADAYINKTVGSPPNFSRLAAEQYAYDPEKWRIPAEKKVQMLHTKDNDPRVELLERYSSNEFFNLAETLGVKIQELSVRADQEMSFDPDFWRTVAQLNSVGDTKFFREESGVFVVRLQGIDESRLRNREDVVPLITSQLEAEWRKAQIDRIMTELRQLEVTVNGTAVIALRDRVLRDVETAQ